MWEEHFKKESALVIEPHFECTKYNHVQALGHCTCTRYWLHTNYGDIQLQNYSKWYFILITKRTKAAIFYKCSPRMSLQHMSCQAGVWVKCLTVVLGGGVNFGQNCILLAPYHGRLDKLRKGYKWAWLVALTDDFDFQKERKNNLLCLQLWNMTLPPLPRKWVKMCGNPFSDP